MEPSGKKQYVVTNSKLFKQPVTITYELDFDNKGLIYILFDLGFRFKENILIENFEEDVTLALKKLTTLLLSCWLSWIVSSDRKKLDLITYANKKDKLIHTAKIGGISIVSMSFPSDEVFYLFDALKVKEKRINDEV